MILERVFRIVIFSETFTPFVIIVINTVSVPVMALDSKVVVGFYRKSGIAVAGLKAGLCKNDAGWYAILVHLSDCQMFIFFYILFSAVILCKNIVAQQNTDAQYYA